MTLDVAMSVRKTAIVMSVILVLIMVHIMLVSQKIVTVMVLENAEQKVLV